MVDISLDALGAAVSNGESEEYTFEIKKPGIDLSNEIVEITKNVTLKFNTEDKIACRQLRFKDCNVKITNMVLVGSIWTSNAQISLINCVIKDPPKGVDHIISLNQNSNMLMKRCRVENSKMFGVSIDTHSTAMIESSYFGNTQFPALALFGFSLARVLDCQIENSAAELVWVDTESDLFMSGCNLHHCKKRAIYVSHGGNANIASTMISDCDFGAMSFFGAGEVVVERSQISNCSHTAIYLERSSIELKYVTITGTKGNAVNASRSSRVLMMECTVDSTAFPSIAVCDSSVGVIKRCQLTNSQMSGIVIRFNSQALIKDTVVSDVGQSGISVSDCQDILIRNCQIARCGRGGVEVYNESSVGIHNIDIEEVQSYGIEAYSSSYVEVKKFSISNANEAAVWLHHGARGSLRRGMVWLDEGEGLKIETNRKVVCKEIVVNDKPIPNYPVGAPEDIDSDMDSSEEEVEPTPAVCLVCGKEAVGVHFNPCAHCVYCRECWANLKEKPTVCPLCKFNIEGVMTLFDNSHEDSEGLCGICFEAQPNTVITPCGHMMCSECAKSWFAQSAECPFCRAPGARPRKLISYQ